MRQCIFCMQWKEEKEFNREHIILEALGGKGDKDICLNVCTTCNSSLGTRVDASLLNQDITKYMRYKFKIKGKNGVPNPFRGVEIKYADTPIIGELKVNKEGKIDGFRAKYQELEYNGKKLIVGPKKGFAQYVNSRLIANGMDSLTEKYILENKFEFGKPKNPHIEYVEFPEEIKEQYLIYAFPAMVKMAYEYCFVMLGEKYLKDCIAVDIRNFLMKYDYKKDAEYYSPTRVSMEWINEENREISLKIQVDNNSIWVRIVLWGMVLADICMSEEAFEYKVTEDNFLCIET